MSRRAIVRFIAVLASLLLLAAACGDDSGGDGGGQASPTTGASTASTTTLTPQKGGIATIGQYSRETGLDPAKLAGGGTVGGIELMAIYDVLMRYDNTSGKYIGRTAESLTPNADFSEWTLKLKAGIKFTDGTDYNADAVKATHDRELKEGNASPKGILQGSVKSYVVVDSLTVKYTLLQPWAGFPYVLAGVNGVIYSPAALAKAGANFNTAPGDAGAGPFKVKSYKPGEAIELERNPTYYGGDVYLDGLKFVFVGGAAQSFESIKAGSLTAAFIREDSTIAKAKDEKYGTIDMPAVAGSILNMNSGIEVTCANGAPANLCAGQPDGTKVKTKTVTSDPNVRRAVAAAVDPKVINDRVYQGKAIANSAPFANFPWDPKVEGPKFDVTQAKAYVAQAKAAGWDGKIRVLAANTPEAVAWGQAVSAMLQAAGMEVALDNTKDTQQIVNQVIVLRDFDVVSWAYGLLDESDGNYLQLRGTFNSANPRYGYGNAQMDAAIDQLRTADTDAKRVAAYKAISEIWVKDVPAHVTSSNGQSFVYSPKLHGAQRTAVSSILLDKAWLEK